MSHSLKHWKSSPSVPELGLNACHIWQIDLATVTTNNEVYLSPQEQQRSKKFLRENDKQQFINIRSILRQLLSRYTSVPEKQIDYRVNDHGKPALASQTASESLYFNITHTQDLALLAFCKSAAVGIDVEFTDRFAKFQKLAQRYFSTQEKRSFTNLNDEQLATHFFRLWTRKEAFVKAVGTGLSFPLDKFSISTDPNTPPVLYDVDTTIYNGPCVLSDIKMQHPYMSAVACLATKMEYKLYDWPLSQA